MAGVAAILLERSVEGRPPTLDDGHGHLVRQHLFDQSEVDQFDESCRSPLHVARLDVAMDHRRILMMHVVQGVEQLQRPVDDQGRFEEPLGTTGVVHQGLQIFARDEIHDEVVAPALGKVVGHLG